MADKKTTDKPQDYQLNTLPRGVFEITVSIPWAEVETARDKAIEATGKNLELKGFRKGKAPAKLVAEAMGENRLLETTLQQVVPQYYQEAITKLELKPILTPKIQLVSAKEGEAWEVKFTSCQEPDVELGNYKEEIKKLKAGKDIWVPGKEGKKEEKTPEQTREEKLNQIIEWLIKNLKVEICDLLVEEEVARKLSGLLDQTQKLGITVEQYLASTGKSIDEVKKEYAAQAQENLALEFILSKIADSENISVEPQEIEKITAQAKTEEEKKALESQKYYLATILRRQKTLDFLASL